MKNLDLSKLFCLLAMFLFTVPASSQSITVDGTSRSYVVYAPKNLGDNRPLLISCHGMNQDANYQKGMLQIESVADTAKFLTVFPQGIDKGWDISGDRDIHFVEALIEKMVTQYKIDRNRVYLSGFSMGGMFTYHAMNKIPDKIAAFAPISGYSMWGTTANANVRPLPIIHTHGTDDDVVNFSGVQGALNVWIKHNGCSTTPTVETRYQGAAHITRRTWGNGNDGVEVVLMEMAGKGHWISNDNGVKTGDEIWRFCKRFSLEMTEPQVRITSPKSDLTFLTFGGSSQTGTITIEAIASDPDGQVVKAQLYDGNNLIEERTENFQSLVFSLPSLTRGTHKIRVIAIDDEGIKGESSITVSVEEPTGNYVFTKVFNTEGSVPQGWATFDGNEHRTGYSDGYSQGCRVFHFTGEQHGFEWGLYARNIDGRTGEGYARFADPATTVTLTLYPGKYQLLHRLANWNIASFSPVRIVLEQTDGTPFYEDIVTPTSNVGNNAANSFSGVTLINRTFELHEFGQYQVTFYTADAPWADLVIGQAALAYKGVVTGIESMERQENADRCFDLQGRQVSGSHKKGIIISNGKKIIIR